jgi:hypothetical protein
MKLATGVHFIDFFLHNLRPWDRFVEQNLMLSSSFRCDQIYNCQSYDFDHALFCYLSLTLMYNKPTSVADYQGSPRFEALALLANIRLAWKGFLWTNQGMLKGEVSLYCWPPVWLVWNELYDNWQFLFLFAKRHLPHNLGKIARVLH